MAEELSTELVFVRRDIRKYLQRNLDPDAGFMLPNSNRIAWACSIIVTKHMVQVFSTPSATPGKLNLRVRFDAQSFVELSADANAELLVYAERCYYQEFHQMVDNLHFVMKVPVTKAVESFRGLYGINEDDFPLKASLRNYNRYLRYQGRSRKRGRKPLPFELLKDGRPRDMNLDWRPMLGGEAMEP